MQDTEPARSSWSRRILRLVTDVHEGEERTALALLAGVFLVLCAYYLIKPAREGWLAVSVVKGISKTELRAYSSFAQTLALIPVVGWYGRMASRFDRARLVASVNAVLAAHLVMFWLLQPGLLFERVPFVGIAFYLWVGMFNVLVVSQFWIFAADLYDYGRGKRLLPLVAVGAALGAVVGAWLGELLVARFGLDPYALLLAAAAPLSASTVLTRYAHLRGPDGTVSGRTARQGLAAVPSDAGNAPQGITGSVKFVSRDRYLAATAGFVLLVSCVGSIGDASLFGVVQKTVENAVVASGISDPATVRDAIARQTTTFYSQLYFWVNLATLVLQVFVASRVLRYAGFAFLLLTLPIVGIVSYATMAAVPALAVIKAMKVAENSTNYSLQNTARHVLWLPATPVMLYYAKPVVDTLCVRLGDGLAALVILVAVRFLAIEPTVLFVLNVVILVAAIAVGLVVAQEHQALLARRAKQG